MPTGQGRPWPVGNRLGLPEGLRNDGTATVIDCSNSGNDAVSYGGGVANLGTLTVEGSTLTANTTSYGGFVGEPVFVPLLSAITNIAGDGLSNVGTLTLTESAVSDNTALGWVSESATMRPPRTAPPPGSMPASVDTRPPGGDIIPRSPGD